MVLISIVVKRIQRYYSELIHYTVFNTKQTCRDVLILKYRAGAHGGASGAFAPKLFEGE